MPKFYRKNQKKNNPRYFLNEGIDNDLETLSEEQEESPNGWCFSKDGSSITPSTGTRDGKPACRGIDDVHVAEKNIYAAKQSFKNMQVAEQKKSMNSIMGKFRNFLNEGFDLDANDDGKLSPDALRRAADELERGVRAGAKARTGDMRLAPGATKSDVMLAQLMSQTQRNLQKRGVQVDLTFHPSVMYRILRSGNMDGRPGNEAQGVEKALEYFYSYVNPPEGADPRGVIADMFPKFESEIEFVKQTIDLELNDPRGSQYSAGLGPNFEPTPFGGKAPRAFVSEAVEMAPVNDAITSISQGLAILQDTEFMSVLNLAQREDLAEMETKIKNLAKIAKGQSSV